MNWIPRNAFASEFSLIVWLYALFPPMTAYAISQTITRIFAFIGMYALLKTHFLRDSAYQPVCAGCALAFSLTPFWPSGMLSTLGMPLALWAFLNIRAGKNITWKERLILTLIPFYSSIVLGFFFFLSAMFLLWFWGGIRGKGWNFRFFAAILYMSAIFWRLSIGLSIHFCLRLFRTAAMNISMRAFRFGIPSGFHLKIMCSGIPMSLRCMALSFYLLRCLRFGLF